MNLGVFLRSEVKPALGCTEPGSVALAAATAVRQLRRKVKRIHVRTSGSIFKNGLNVGVPGTRGGRGNLLAAALGALAGDPDKGLQSLEGITDEDVSEAKRMVDEGLVTQEVTDDPGVYVEVQLYTDDERASTVISGRHDNVFKVTRDDETVFNGESGERGGGEKPLYLEELTAHDMAGLWGLSEEIDAELQRYLLDGSEMNMGVADEGLREPWGLGVGFHLNAMAPSDDLLYKVKAYAAAAADVRMGGGPWPIMSSSGSGNHGITAVVPPSVVSSSWGRSSRELAEALALSHLVTRYIKAYTGILSPVCGCAIAAGAGAAAAIVKLGGGSPAQAESAVASLIASVMGMTCDGGKGSCALKVSTAAGEAYIAAMLAMRGVGITESQGILKPDLRSVAQVLGEVSEKGMPKMDEVILGILQRL